MIRPHYVPLFQSICTNERYADLRDDTARTFYVMLLTHGDSWGRCKGGARVLNALVWPMLGKSAADTERALAELARVGLIVRYEVDGESFLAFPDWEDGPGRVGKVDRRGPSLAPPPPEANAAAPARRTSPATGPRPVNAAEDSRLARAGESEPSRTEPSRTEHSGARAPDHVASPSSTTSSKAAKAARKPASGPQPELIRHFEAEWIRTRPTGGAFVVTSREAAGAASLVADLGLEEAKRRVSLMLDDGSAWALQNASLSLLASQPNRWAVVPQRQAGAQPPPAGSLQDMFGAGSRPGPRTIDATAEVRHAAAR